MYTFTRSIILLLTFIKIMYPQSAWKILRHKDINICLTEVMFVDVNTGWAAGDNKILKTNDGGYNWTEYTFEGMIFTGLYANSNWNVWAVDMNGYVWETANGGNTWISTRLCSFLSKTHGIYACGWKGMGMIFKRTGYGVWESINPDPDYPYIGATFYGIFSLGSNIWAQTSGVMWGSNDGGNTWPLEGIFTETGDYGIYFVDENIGWVAGKVGDEISKTTDGGYTWNTFSTGLERFTNLFDIFMLDSNNGWIVGKNGSMIYTLDGGETWTIDSLGFSNQINSVHFVNSEVGWAVGDNIILKYDKRPASLNLTLPNSSSIWKTETFQYINWTFTNVNFIRIEYSINQGQSWNIIEEKWPAGSKPYKWEVPNETSNKCLLKITDFENVYLYSISPLFSMRGYILAKFNSSSIDTFKLYKNTWLFENTEDDMWPVDWWGGVPPRFDYSSAPYPWYWTHWPINAQSKDFPDWPMFVSVFGEEECYLPTFTSKIYYNPMAEIFWSQIKKEWNGSCYGFAVSCFMVYDFKEEFLNKYPDLEDFDTLSDFGLKPDENIRKVINELFVYQYGKNHQKHLFDNWKISPLSTLIQLKNMILGDIRDDRILIIYQENPALGHAVNPYSIEQDPDSPNIYKIFVFDSNYPFEKLYIEVDAETESWSYEKVNVHNAKYGLFLSNEISSFISTPKMKKTGQNISKTESNSLFGINIYNIANSIMKITTQNNDTLINYDHEVINSIPGVFPIIPITGDYSKPIGFNLYFNGFQYSIETSNSSDSASNIIINNVYNNMSNLYRISRNDVNYVDTDKIIFEPSNSDIKLINKDEKSKVYDYSRFYINRDDIKEYVIANFDLSTGDSINFNHWYPIDAQKILNHGASKLYDLKIVSYLDTVKFTFEHKSIRIQENSSHHIYANFGDLSNDSVIIYVDNGFDYTIDDTLMLKNDYTSVDKKIINQILPSEYDMYQNYPNPFNQSTNIKFTLPTSKYVELKVFNILGKEVVHLVSGKLNAGNHTYQFDGSNLASGIYYYSIQAGDSHQVRKMVLLK